MADSMSVSTEEDVAAPLGSASEGWPPPILLLLLAVALVAVVVDDDVSIPGGKCIACSVLTIVFSPPSSFYPQFLLDSRSRKSDSIKSLATAGYLRIHSCRMVTLSNDAIRWYFATGSSAGCFLIAPPPIDAAFS